MNISIQVGAVFHIVECSVLPPVGTKIIVDKDVAEDGEAVTLQVISHEWRMRRYYDPETDESPTEIDVSVHTKSVGPG